MLRLLTLLPVAALATLAPAAPVPTHLFPKEPPLYFPTTAGTKLVYEDRGEELTLVISKAERTAAGTEVTVERVSGDERTDHQKFVVSASGLVQTEVQGWRLAHPCVRLKVPAKPGDSWVHEDEEQFRWSRGFSRVSGVEKVKVPAGTFEAIRVDLEYTLAGQKMEASHWYAPRLGLVKVSSTAGTRLLKSFTPGKD